MESLKKNEYVSPYTFEEFIARQSRGKKHYFLRADNPQQEVAEMS